MTSNAARRAQLQALSRRLGDAPAPVQALLRQKLAQGQAELARNEPAVVPIVVKQARKVDAACEPLALLNRHANEASAGGDDLPSVIRFRRGWSRTRAADRVLEAAAQRPAQAGPLNSHVLMLESLDLMRALSPDYLRRFIAHAETLLWLEALGAAVSPARKAKAPRRG